MVLGLLPIGAQAEDRLVRLHAPEALVETGLLKHILPRFSLKTQVRVELVDDLTSADVVFGDDGRALFAGVGATWHLSMRRNDHLGTDRFVSWLNSDVGLRTITGFAPDGEALFTPPGETQVEVAELEFDGDSVVGKRAAQINCGRCHAIESGSMNGIGSTPSFPVLRSLNDWEERFTAFYALKPHPSFTQIEDITAPFPLDRPSPIVPITLTLDEVEAILSFVALMSPADLGAPLIHQ